MARTAIAIGGAAIGIAGAYATGNPGYALQAAQLGFAVGAVVGAALFPPESSYPHMADKRIGDSSYGKPIIDVWGADKIPGNMIWTGGIEENTDTSSNSGGSDGSSTTSYFASFGVGLCKGPVEAIRKVWLDHKLVYDVSATNLQLANAILNSSVNAGGASLTQSQRQAQLDDIIAHLAQVQSSMSIYLGTDTQNISPLQEAYKGQGNVPAYNGLCYLEFEDLPLANYGNHHPTVQAEVLKTSTPAAPKQSLVPAAAAGMEPLIFDQYRQRLVAIHSNGYHVIDAFNSTIIIAGTFPATENWFSYGPFTAGDAVYDIGPDGHTYTLVQGPGGAQYLAERDTSTMLITNIGMENPLVAPATAKGMSGGAAFMLATHDYVYVAMWGLFPGLNAIYAFAMPHVINPKSGQPYGFLTHVFTATTDLKPAWMVQDKDGKIWVTCHHPIFLSNEQTLLYELPSGNVTAPGLIFTPVYDLTTAIRHGGDMAYDFASHSLIINGIDPVLNFPGITVQFDIATQTIIQTLAGGISGGFKSWKRGIVGGNMWLGTGLILFQRFNVASFSIEETINLTTAGYTHSGQVFGAVYDPETDAIWATENFVGFSKFFLHRLGYPSVTVAEVIEAIGEQVGYDIAADFDTSAVLDTMWGYSFTRHTTGAQNLAPLLQAFQIALYQSDWKLRFRPRGPRAPVANLTLDDLGAREADDDPVEPFRIGILDKTALPTRMYLSFSNPDIDYEQDTVYAMRHQGTAGLVREDSISTPIIFSNVNAKHLVERLLYERWQNLYEYSTTTHHGWLALDPSDVITVEYNNRTYALGLSRVDVGANWIIELQGFAYDPDTYIDSDSIGGASYGITPPTLNRIAATRLFIMDIPLLRDVDDGPGYYVAVAQDGAGTWPGAIVQISIDGTNFDELLVAQNQVAYGVAETALADSSPYVFDRESVVRLHFTTAVTLVSITESAALNGANALLLGDELVNFVNATQIDARTWDVDLLLRGRRGTEWATSTHTAGDRCFLLERHTIYRVPSNANEIGAPRYLRAVTLNTPTAGAPIQGFTNQAKGLYPYAPDHVAGTRDGSGNLVIVWNRRTRVNGEWRWYVDVPLGETAEAYEVDILDGTDVVRALTSITETVTYTAAQQTMDFGSPQSSVDIVVYQLSDVVGRGFGRSATV